MFCPFCSSPISATDTHCINCNNLLNKPSDIVSQRVYRVKSTIFGLVLVWLVNLVVIGFVSFLILIFGVPIIVFLKTGVIQLIPEMAMVYNAIAFTVIAAIGTGTVLWIFAFFESNGKDTKK
jgi:predicted nucleic acid-binding Zn ribbon protein